jgi:hypothetical protein
MMVGLYFPLYCLAITVGLASKFHTTGSCDGQLRTIMIEPGSYGKGRIY